MNWGKKKKRILTAFAIGVFTVTGTYNAVVINSESSITGSEVKFVKRLDELYGVTIPGRTYAATKKTWHKLNNQEVVKHAEVQQQQIVQEVRVADAALTEAKEVVPAAVQEDLNMGLVEVINPNKWQAGLNSSQFSGSLTTSGGTIESLSISLPGDEGVSVSFAEMTGNVFEYDLNGEVYSGMLFQVDQTSYMVTLTNGPLEGTRLKFTNDDAIPLTDGMVTADNIADVETGSFAAEALQPETMLDTSIEMTPEMQASQGFNFDGQHL